MALKNIIIYRPLVYIVQNTSMQLKIISIKIPKAQYYYKKYQKLYDDWEDRKLFGSSTGNAAWHEHWSTLNVGFILVSI